VTTLEGDGIELSQDFTLSDEGEGDNISSNKELRKKGDDEDQNNSKRAKVPLQTPAAESENPNYLKNAKQHQDKDR
jgi:hypothetical protein